VVPHQANLRIIQAMAKRLNMPMEKVVLTIINTATLLRPPSMALDEAVRDGRIKRTISSCEAFGAADVGIRADPW